MGRRKTIECRACKNDHAIRSRTLYDGGVLIESCDRCGDPGFYHFPDVYVDGKPDMNLPDDPKTGKPPVFTSRLDKQRFLKQHKLIEVRGRERGGPSIPSSEPQYDPAKSKHETMMALKHVREMGRDQRRQEYLRITQSRRG
jgi:hypothetical protein